jgi:hypothetical protein
MASAANDRTPRIATIRKLAWNPAKTANFIQLKQQSLRRSPRSVEFLGLVACIGDSAR